MINFNLIKRLLTSIILLFIIYTFNYNSSYGQGTIYGEVKNDDGNPVPYANILILNPEDTTLVKGSISSDNGGYRFEDVPAGEYLLSATMVGFDQHYSNTIEVRDEEIKSRDIVLKEDVKELNEVMVKARKPFFEKEIDRTVVNVESSILATGSSVLEILERSPGIVVNRQSNSISMNGNSGVLVMINDRVTRLPMNAVIQMLDGMNSANISKIELITTPPAKYEAEGDAGIIHIVSKANIDYGTNGNFSLGAGLNWAEILQGNFNLNHKGKKFGVFLNYNIRYDRNRHISEFESEIENENFISHKANNAIRKPKQTVHNLRTGFEYSFTDNTKLGLLLSGSQSFWDMTAFHTDINKVTMDSTVYTDTKVEELNKWQNISANFGIDHDFDNQSNLSFDLDYLHYMNHNPSVYYNEFIFKPHQETGNEKVDADKRTPINLLVAKIDYQAFQDQPFSLDMGIKGSRSGLDNTVTVRRLKQNIWSDDSELSSISELSESIGMGYISFLWDASENWQLKGGIRYEYTDSYLTSQEKGVIVDREYGNLFPSFFISRNISENSKINAAYSRRITRPEFNDLAPFFYLISPNTYITGNISIQPALSDKIELSYQLKGWIASLNYTNTKNDITRWQPDIDKEKDQVLYRPYNLDYMRTWALNLSFPITLTDWWDIQGNINGFYNDFKTLHLDNDVKQEIFNYTLNASSNFNLPHNFSIEISGNYYSKNFWGIMVLDPYGSLNFGFQKKFNNKGGTLSLSINDIFNTFMWNLHSKVPKEAINTYAKYSWHQRSVMLTYSLSFGSNKVGPVKVKSGAGEERERVNY